MAFGVLGLASCNFNQPIDGKEEVVLHSAVGNWALTFSNPEYTAAFHTLTVKTLLMGGAFQSEGAKTADGTPVLVGEENTPVASGNASYGNISFNFRTKSDTVKLSCEGSFNATDDAYSGTCTRAITGEKVSLSMKKLS
ncbi:MAG: hypothetical protein Q4C89_07860 [Deinococcus sp.]|uniref:hypothetical protein n=1 Tax=Deinococcus sp. TaxID=47478 RepID=UPI0026DD9952|nr:hypothetical protein [Deinococcus sp.]MDO4245920.1 hypothetical protein [Deinococcus sp.]